MEILLPIVYIYIQCRLGNCGLCVSIYRKWSFAIGKNMVTKKKKQEYIRMKSVC